MELANLLFGTCEYTNDQYSLELANEMNPESVNVGARGGAVG
jgi:hypothetical protein